MKVAKSKAKVKPTKTKAGTKAAKAKAEAKAAASKATQVFLRPAGNLPDVPPASEPSEDGGGVTANDRRKFYAQRPRARRCRNTVEWMTKST